MPTNGNLRNWTERNQGPMPQSDPLSKNNSQALDIGQPKEGDETNGSVRGEPGASGNRADGTSRESENIGGTGNLSSNGRPKA